MASKPAIPALVLVPEDSRTDCKALHAVATAYAHSGLLISDYANKTSRVEFTFPAIVCSSFAIELFMKFFIMLGKAEKEDSNSTHERGHNLSDLWGKIDLEHQQLIASMFRNDTGTPLLNAVERRTELFVEALAGIGSAPFTKWRYVHEETRNTLMSHGAVVEVLDALGHAADYIMKQRAKAF